MKLFFSFVFLLFSSLLFQVQIQAQVLVPGSVFFEYDFDEFDWQAFIDEENIQKHIDSRKQRLYYFGPDSIITGLNLDKLDLIRLEIELDLYKQGIKQGLSGDEIQQAEEAIRRHRENVDRIENQMRFWAGLGGSDEGFTVSALVEAETDYRLGAWELYKGDRDIVFNMVEKKDEDLYEALGGSNEVYAGFITPYVEKYTAKMKRLGLKYYSSLESAYEGKAEFDGVNVMRLIEMYDDSLEIHDCFKENFEDWTGGAKQRSLEEAVKGWHTQQALWGMKSYVEGYRNYKKEYGTSFEIDSAAANLFKFTEAPEEVRKEMIDFYRDEIWNNEELKASKEEIPVRARVNALIGLNYMDALNEEERNFFNRAIEEGFISNPGGEDVFFGYGRPVLFPQH